MFIDFLFHLRACGLRVSLTEWMMLTEALVRGHARCNLTVFYDVARSVLVKDEGAYDLYDRAFAAYFQGVEATFELDDRLWEWLQNPVLPRPLTPEELAQLEAWDLDTLRRELERRLREQQERHDGGNRWIGTGGTSPFGHGGTHPAGVRVGGTGGGRSAVQVAETRRFRNLRRDRVLDTRQLGAALRRLKRLARKEGEPKLDLEETIDTSAKNGGEIELVFRPPRTNRVKLALMMDVGGSMDPHSELCERLFSAAHAAHHFKAFKHYFFHNCIYGRLYSDMTRLEGEATHDVLRQLDATWSVIVVGDAWMSPYELTHVGGSIYYYDHNRVPGLTWLQRLREKVPNSVWLNPEPERIWAAESVRLIRDVYPMYRLTLDGLSEAVDVLRGARPNTPTSTRLRVADTRWY